MNMTEQKITIRPGTVQETLLIPLYARKKCTDKFPELYTDPKASEICGRIEYDFSGLDKKYESTAYEFGAMEGAMRQLDMMFEIRDYLKKNPDASIVCLGCGLDFDARRCGDARNRIFNVDFPDVIAAREELGGLDERDTNIRSDLTDLSWMDKIEAAHGAVFYAAGVFHYLKAEDVKQIVLTMADRFPGSRLIFDMVGPFGYKMMMKVALKEHGMGDLGNMFYSSDPKKMISAWSDRLRVSVRGYMLGYSDMKAPGVRASHRFLARLGDRLMKMTIVKIEMQEAEKPA